MLRKLFILVLFLFVLTTYAAEANGIEIIPRPAKVERGEGYFRLTPRTRLAVKGDGAERAVGAFAAKVRHATGYALSAGKAGSANVVSFILDKSVNGDEAYTIDISHDRVVCRASRPAGLFYAAQSLLQLLPAEVEGNKAAAADWKMPVCRIEDAPRFAYRGMMLDPCRHFLPAEDVKRQIDLLSSYKINRLHWHLTDDQGWRIEIKKYPELTKVGARRNMFDGTFHTGYYTQDEIRDVVAYAAERFVEVVPELELPGHGMAAIAAYPHLSCRGEQLTPRVLWGVEEVVMCPGKEDMFDFLRDVIDEMTPLFPSGLFHIGGDESPRYEWKKCPKCQARMHELGYTKEAQLQSYVIGRVEKYLRTKGKTIVGWDEILEGGDLDTTAVVMSWRGEKGGIEAARQHHHVLMTPSSHGLYLDHNQYDPALEQISIGGNATIDRIYAYDPVPEQLREAGLGHYVLGVQGNNWSEYTPTAAALEARLYPRALAVAEIAWTPLERKDFKDFVRRAYGEGARRLDSRGVRQFIAQPAQPGGSTERVAFTDEVEIALEVPEGMQIVYTVDGSRPDAASPRYESPIRLSSTTVVRCRGVLPSGLMSPVREIWAERQALAPACRPDTVSPGLLMNVYPGNFRTAAALGSAQAAKTDSVIKKIETLRAMAGWLPAVDGYKDYAATAEGYISIPEDGVYEFRTLHAQLFIDDRRLIDNGDIFVLRSSPHNAQCALRAGLHKIRAVFVGGIFDGWPTYWNEGNVDFRPAGGKWQKIGADMLFH